MVHAQAAHMINIYEIGDSDDEKTDTEASDEVSSINNDGIVDTIDKVNGNGVAAVGVGGAQQEVSNAVTIKILKRLISMRVGPCKGQTRELLNRVPRISDFAIDFKTPTD
jgi:hypothetical protein